MLYTAIQYRDKFYHNKSIRTVQRMISLDRLPAGHNRVVISKRSFVETSGQKDYEPYILAIRDYFKRKKICVDLELSTECGITHNNNSIKFLNEILGY